MAKPTRGAAWHPASKSWQARAVINGKRVSLGYYATKWDADAAYRAAKEKYRDGRSKQAEVPGPDQQLVGNPLYVLAAGRTVPVVPALGHDGAVPHTPGSAPSLPGVQENLPVTFAMPTLPPEPTWFTEHAAWLDARVRRDYTQAEIDERPGILAPTWAAFNEQLAEYRRDPHMELHGIFADARRLGHVRELTAQVDGSAPTGDV